MIAIDIDKKTFDLPENWSEVVAAGKYMDVVQVNYTHTDEPAARAEILKRLTGIHIDKNTSDHVETIIALQLVEECLPVLDFIFKPELLTVNPLPVITHNKIKYYGPGEKLQEQTGAEMEECGWAHAEFVKTGDEKYLNHLVATLYRPASGKKKLPFDKHKVEEYANRFATLDPLTKRGVLLYYEMCEEWWKQNYAFLYEGGGAEPEPGAPAPVVDSLANSRIIRALAGGKRGIVEQVRTMERHEIYFELSELERERRALEK